MSGFLIALSLGAGAIAAFNPCGVAVFPSYLAVLFQGEGGRRHPLAAGLAAGFLMTLGFFTVFGLAGLLVASVGQLLFHVAPYVSVALALVVLALGVASLMGRVTIPALEALLLKGGRQPRSLGVRLYAYGLAYAFLSLSCALPVFLAIAVQAISLGPGAAILTFLVYAFGMGAVITAASVLTFVAREWVQAHIVGIQPWITRAMGAVLLVSGAYLLWYWLLGPQHLLAIL